MHYHYTTVGFLDFMKQYNLQINNIIQDSPGFLVYSLYSYEMHVDL